MKFLSEKELKKISSEIENLNEKINNYEEIIREFAKRLFNKKMGKRRNDCSSKKALRIRLKELGFIDEKDNIVG